MLQEEKKKLQEKWRRNNIVVSGIPGHVSERDLEETAISMLSDIEVNVSTNDVWSMSQNRETLMSFLWILFMALVDIYLRYYIVLFYKHVYILVKHTAIELSYFHG